MTRRNNRPRVRKSLRRNKQRDEQVPVEESQTRQTPKKLFETVPYCALGVTPSSAVLARFLKGRKPGTGVLLDMPTELVENIAAFLPMSALGNLRLTCKELEKKILWYFSRTYFQRMSFMHSKYALEALVAVSKSRMAQYVRTLALGPPSNDQGVVTFFSPEPAPKEKRQVTRAMYHYAEENRLMRTYAQDAVMIESAIQNLSGVNRLEFLGLERDCGCLFCGTCPSYGVQHFCNVSGGGKAGFTPMPLDSTQSLPRLFYITLNAAQVSGLCLESVDAHTTDTPNAAAEGGLFSGWGSYPLVFPSAPPRELATDSTFAALSTLKLFFGYHHDVCNAGRRALFVESLLTFLSRAPALQTLGLYLRDTHGIIQCVRELTHSPTLRGIKHLELAGVESNVDEFTDVLEPLATSLTALRLKHFEVDDYFPFLRWMRDKMLALNELTLWAVGDDSGWCPDRTHYKGDDFQGFCAVTLELWAEDLIAYLELEDEEDSDE